MNTPKALATVGLVLLALSACAVKPRADFTYTTDKRYPARPPDHPIEVFRDEPSRTYDIIGEVTGSENAWTDSPDGESPCLKMMKEHARRMGGDAIIHFSMESERRGYSSQARDSGGAVSLLKAKGVVVRWN